MSSAKRKLVLKKLNSHNTIWHPESTLVFKSQKERLVIGRYVDEQLISLDEEALDLCDEWKFNPDESLLETGNEEESVEEVDGEQDENKVDSVEDDEADEADEAGESGEEEEVETKVDSLEENNKDESDDNNDVRVTETKVDSVKNVEKESDNKDILDLASELSAKLNEGFSMVKGRLDKSDNENKDLRAKLAETESRLADTEDKLSSLQSEYDVIKKKFDTMKSLFA